MIARMRLSRAAGLLLAFALVGLAGPAAAQDTKVGKIDMEKLYAKYTHFQKLSEEYRGLVQQLSQRLEERRTKYQLLDPDEWNTLSGLFDKQMTGPLPPADAAKLAELNKKAQDFDRELDDLEGKATLSPAEQARIKVLRARKTATAQSIEKLGKDLKERVENRDRELSKQIKDKIDTAVAQVAQAQGLNIVVRADMVFFGGTDITDAVLAILNK